MQFAHPRYWPAWCLVGLQRGLTLLPLPVLWALGCALGAVMHRVGGCRRRVAARNIERCLPELDPTARRRLLVDHFHALGFALLAMPITWWASPRRLDRLIRFRGREHYDEALAEGRGVVLLAPHFVALEVPLALARERPMIFMYQRLKNPLLDAVMERGRRRFHGEIVERSANLKGTLRRLRQGVPLGYLPDQNPGPQRGIFVPFFGIPTATHPALSRIAAMTGAVVIPCIAKQLPFGRGFEVEFKPPLEDFPSGDVEADTARMNRVIEQCVRELPEQYFWVHKRFKVRPPGEPDFYRRGI